jgi:hypothetical protein
MLLLPVNPRCRGGPERGTSHSDPTHVQTAAGLPAFLLGPGSVSLCKYRLAPPLNSWVSDLKGLAEPGKERGEDFSHV